MKSTFKFLMALLSAVFTLAATVCLVIAYWETVCRWLDYMLKLGEKLWKTTKECFHRHITVEPLAENDDGIDESCFAD